MKNFPVQTEFGEYWISRSVAVALFPFCKDANGNWCVLANKRGKGCPDNIGLWNCPCGYLDWDETTRQAAIREAFEETGIKIDAELVSVQTCSDTGQNRQNVVEKFYVILPHKVEYYVEQFSNKNSELNEIDDICFVPVNCIEHDMEWAFGHKENILDIFNTYIDIPWWKKIILKLYRKYFYVS